MSNLKEMKVLFLLQLGLRNLERRLHFETFEAEAYILHHLDSGHEEFLRLEILQELMIDEVWFRP